jgi:hypothetical protein
MVALIEGLPARIKLRRRLLMIDRALPRGLQAKIHNSGAFDKSFILLAWAVSVRLLPPRRPTRVTLLRRR